MRERVKYNRKSYTIADFYINYKQQIDANTQYDVNLKTYKAIVTDYFKYIRDEIMQNCKEFKLPCRLGTLQIIKHQPKEFSGKSLRWDFKYRFHWSKKNCLLTNKSKYQFIASRENKRTLAQIIFNKLKDYPEL